MLMLAKLLCIFIVGLGTAIALNPAVFKSIMNFWKKGKNVYIAGAVRLIFGAIFLAIASRSRVPIVISIFGILMLIGGAAIFIIGPKRIHKIFEWWEKKPYYIIRLMGLVAITLGAFIVYAI